MNITDYLFSEALVGGGGGGGGSSWELLYSTEVEASTESTTTTTIKDIDLTDADYLQEDNAIYWIQIRDKQGRRAGYHLGTDCIFLNTDTINGGSCYMYSNRFIFCEKCGSDGKASFSASEAGVFASVKLFSSSERSFSIKTKYGTGSGTIDGTYTVKFYKLSPPSENWF